MPCPNRVWFLLTHNEQFWSLLRNSEARRLLLNRNDAICSRMSQTEALSRKTMQCEAEASRTSHYASERVSEMMQRLEQALRTRAEWSKVISLTRPRQAYPHFLVAKPAMASPGSGRRDASRDDTRSGAPAETDRPRFSRIPLRSSTSYAATTASIGTPNSTGQRCAYPAPATNDVRHLAESLGAFLFWPVP
jgi:hypothetical protein